MTFTNRPRTVMKMTGLKITPFTVCRRIIGIYIKWPTNSWVYYNYRSLLTVSIILLFPKQMVHLHGKYIYIPQADTLKDGISPHWKFFQLTNSFSIDSLFWRVYIIKPPKNEHIPTPKTIPTPLKQFLGKIVFTCFICSFLLDICFWNSMKVNPIGLIIARETGARR